MHAAASGASERGRVVCVDPQGSDIFSSIEEDRESAARRCGAKKTGHLADGDLGVLDIPPSRMRPFSLSSTTTAVLCGDQYTVT